MKFALLALVVVGSTAFNPSVSFQRSSTLLHLFGGGNKDGGAAKKPNMLDQLSLFKKAQEIAQKKKDIENDLAKVDYTGTTADGKVTATIKFVPSTNPMDPNPEYAVTSFKFDDEYYAQASTIDLSEAVIESYRSGIENARLDSEEKFKSLAADLQAIMGGIGQ